MFDKLKKIKENKVLNFIYNFVYYIFFAFVVLLLIVVFIQRVSNNEISLGGYRIFNILTGSMMPEYEVGDVILAKEAEIDELKVGDDVVYLGKKDDFFGKIITHEIIEIKVEEDGTKTFYTKGLANEFTDPAIKGDQIKGKVVYKFIILSLLAKLINNLYSMYFVIFIPIAFIIFRNIMVISADLREKKNNDKEEK